jgi:hypothetical protein|tara:strand:+ start:941 stop:1363 length:423 start_codon:yes stop_codon:yes gene_type:complete
MDLTLILIIIGITIFLWLGWNARVSWHQFKFWLSKRRGTKGEELAVDLLIKNGYKILSSQIPFNGTLKVDGGQLEFKTRVDFLVEKGGEQFLAEVKTGASASISNIQTRRQLLEYAHLSHSKKILLVDATGKKIRTIEFS